MNPGAPLVLWDLPPEEHGAFVAAGCGTETMEQYAHMLERERDFARRQGREAVLLRLSVQQVLAELVLIGLPCTPAGIALALRSLYEKRVKNGLDPRGGSGSPRQ